MRSIEISRYGAPEVLRERASASPRPGPGQVVVRTAAAGVNFADIMQRLGLYENAPRPPYVPGFEVAGEVVAVGPEVEGRAVGDRVVAMVVRGGYAEEVLVDCAQVFTLPAGMEFTTAAALPVNALTAWFCLFEMGNLRPDDTVLVHGGAGGVGTVAVQLARRHGATVVATAGSERKLEFVRTLGADLAVDYRDPEWHTRVREHFGPRGIDLILDPVGGEVMRRGAALLAPLGRLICYGLSQAVAGPRRSWLRVARAWLATPRINPLNLTTTNTGFFGFHLALLQGKEQRVHDALVRILALVAAGEISPVVDATFPLTATGAAAAHRHIHARGNVGKVLLVAEAD